MDDTMMTRRAVFTLLLLLFASSCHGQSDFLVKITDAIEITEQTVRITWTVVPSFKPAFVRVLYSGDNWATQVQVPEEFVLFIEDNSSLVSNSPFDSMNSYKVCVCDLNAVCSAYSAPSVPVNAMIDMKVHTTRNNEDSILIHWEQANKFEYPLSSLSLEVAINSADKFNEISGSANFFDTNMYFVQNGLYSRDLSKYRTINTSQQTPWRTFSRVNNQYESTNTLENLQSCQQLAYGLENDYFVFLQTSQTKLCYFDSYLKPFFFFQITDISDIAGYVAVNASSFAWNNVKLLSGAEYTIKLSYTTAYNTRGSSTTKFNTPSRVQPPNDSNSSLAIAIAVPIASVIALSIIAVCVLIAYRFVRYGSPFNTRGTNSKRSKLYENKN